MKTHWTRPGYTNTQEGLTDLVQFEFIENIDPLRRRLPGSISVRDCWLRVRVAFIVPTTNSAACSPIVIQASTFWVLQTKGFVSDTYNYKHSE